MTLVQIYCIGFVTQALWLTVTWLRKSKQAKDKFYERLDEIDGQDIISPRKMFPFVAVLTCLIWPYFLIDKFLLKRNGDAK